MSKLDELLNKYCSNGTEYRKIDDFIDYIQPGPYIVNSTKYDDAFAIPVLTAGQSFILGYTDEQTGIYKASKENPVIIFDDFTGGFHWVDFNFKVKSSALKILIPKNKLLNFRFFYYMMGKINLKSSEHTRLWIGTYSQIEIPYPNLEVQCEIVRILDNFAELTAELTAELSLRKSQYKFYLNSLFSSNNYETIELVKNNKILRGKRLTTRDLIADGKYPVYHGGIEPLGYYNDFNRQPDTVMIINVGASAGSIAYSKDKFWSSDGCYCLDHSDKFLNKYLYYFLLTKEDYLKSKVRKAGIPTLDKPIVEKINVPAISTDEQRNIVDILDKFNSIISDIQIGLPAEIEGRKKQYEYYRDNLLTFKRLED